MLIKFQGKNRELRMTYKSIHFLELAFGESYIEFVAKQTPFNQSLYLFWAMLQNDPEFEGKDVLAISELLQNSLDAYEFTLTEYFAKVNSSYQSSLIIKQLFEKEPNPDEESLPSNFGGHRVSAFGRKVLHGIMFRLRNISQRFLDKHSV